MTTDKRATFAKVLIENGSDAKTIYSFRLERIHWIFAIIASIAAVAISLVVLRGAVYASVQNVAAEEFRTQLNRFHSEAKPAIRILIDERIFAAAASQMIEEGDKALIAAMNHAADLASINETLGRLDERLEAIERRIP